MKAEIVNVTPQMAADWLKFNTGNRPLRRTVVNGLKLALQRGEYIPSHQGIAFSDEGVLLDGQHRLTAISELRDGAFPMLVTWGVSPEAFKVMDIGIKRTAADSLGEDRRVVEVARLIAVMCEKNKASITPTMLIPIIEIIEDAHYDLLRFAPATVKTWSSAPVRAAAVISILEGKDSDYVKATYRSLVMSHFESMPRVAQALVKSHLEGKVRASAAYDMFSRSLVAFDPAKAHLVKIQISNTGVFTQRVRDLFALAIQEKEAAPEGAARNVSTLDYSRTKRKAG